MRRQDIAPPNYLSVRKSDHGRAVALKDAAVERKRLLHGWCLQECQVPALARHSTKHLAELRKVLISQWRNVGSHET